MIKLMVLAVFCVVGHVTSCPIFVNIGGPDNVRVSDTPENTQASTKDDRTHPTVNPTHATDRHGRTIQYHSHPIANHTHSPDHHTHPSAIQSVTHPHDPHHHTHPSQDFIGFSVGSRKRFTTYYTARVPMEITLYNPSGHFRSDNAFYAPVKGVYSFSFSGTSAEGKDIYLELFTQKRGASKVTVAVALDEPSPGRRGLRSEVRGGASASVIIVMDVGESASVWLAGSPNYVLYADADSPSTLFSGKLEKQLD